MISWSMARLNGRSRMLISGTVIELSFSTTGSASVLPGPTTTSLLKTSGSFQLSSRSSSILPLVTPRFQAPEFSDRIWRMRTW